MERNKAASLLVGLAVGDAVGVPYEFKERGTFCCVDMIGYGTHNQPKGTWSDDTSLALCLAESVAEGFDLENLAYKFYDWQTKAYMTAHDELFDIGNATMAAITKLACGIEPTKCGGRGERDNGNGSLMRIAPIVFYSTDYEDVKNVSSITHAHKWSVDACWVFVKYLENILKGMDKGDAYKAIQGLDVDEKVLGVLPSNLAEKKESEIKSSGFVLDTLQASIWCFLTTDNYKDAILKAVNLGSDTDTTACVTGAVAGLYYGLDDIPTKWKESLTKKDMIMKLAERLEK